MDTTPSTNQRGAQGNPPGLPNESQNHLSGDLSTPQQPDAKNVTSEPHQKKPSRKNARHVLSMWENPLNDF